MGRSRLPPQAVDDLVETLVAAARAGLSPVQGAELAAGADSRWQGVLLAYQRGVPLPAALGRFAREAGDLELELVARCLHLHGLYGGSLPQLLSALAVGQRERRLLRGELQARTAEGRFSAWILGSMPPLLGLYLVLVDPGLMRPLIVSGSGRWSLGLSVLLWLAGIFVVRRAVEVRELE